MYESLYGIYWLPLECFLEVFGVIILVFLGPSSASPAHTQASSLRVASAGCAKRKQYAGGPVLRTERRRVLELLLEVCLSLNLVWITYVNS